MSCSSKRFWPGIDFLTLTLNSVVYNTDRYSLTMRRLSAVISNNNILFMNGGICCQFVCLQAAGNA